MKMIKIDDKNKYKMLKKYVKQHFLSQTPYSLSKVYAFKTNENVDIFNGYNG